MSKPHITSSLFHKYPTICATFLAWRCSEVVRNLFPSLQPPTFLFLPVTHNRCVQKVSIRTPRPTSSKKTDWTAETLPVDIFVNARRFMACQATWTDPTGKSGLESRKTPTSTSSVEHGASHGPSLLRLVGAHLICQM
jgi:hypothetical protein